MTVHGMMHKGIDFLHEKTTCVKSFSLFFTNTFSKKKTIKGREHSLLSVVRIHIFLMYYKNNIL